MGFRHITCSPRIAIMLSLIAALLPVFSPSPGTQAQTQTLTDLIDISISAGYGSYFRENHWLPLRIRVQNTGDDINGRLIVRPETSGLVVTNAYSTPIDLPTGSDKTAFLYIMAQPFPPQVTVELLDADGRRVAQRETTISAIDSHDLLHVVISNTSAATLPLNTAHVGGFAARQVRWTPQRLPANAAALRAIDTLIFTDVDSTALSAAQRAAVVDWVAGGGHLIVTGGANWQQTAAAFRDVLPLLPDDSQQIDGLGALALWSGLAADDLNARTTIATGDLNADAAARVLVASADALPLLVRRDYGAGAIDYFAADPALQPLSGWQSGDAMWLNIIASTQMRPAWTMGIADYSEAEVAVGVLPGVDLLPPVLSMVAFIGVYVLLIGPLNYIVLARINRRGWAWVTIPVLIGVFSVLAYNVGFNLRGSEVILSRINIIESWPESDEARLQQLVGVLSPRRETYSLSAGTDTFLNVMPQDDAIGSTGLINALDITRSTADIVQTSAFEAEDFAVDGGIFANFITEGRTARPAINGRLSLIYNAGPDDAQALQGVVRNDSDVTLRDAVILARGLVYELPGPLEPGDVLTLAASDLILRPGSEYPHPAPIELSHNLLFGNNARSISAQSASVATRDAILGEDALQSGRIAAAGLSETQVEALERRYALLTAFVRDQFASQAYGGHAYLLGWADNTDDVAAFASDISLGDVPFSTVDTALYVVALDIESQQRSNERVTIRPDQFTWTALARAEPDNGGPNDLLLLAQNEVVLRFRPLPDAQLRQVESMTVRVDRNSSRARDVMVELWNWRAGEWEALRRGEVRYDLQDPARFVGPDNMVDMRLTLTSDLGTARIRGLSITHTGVF
jgi:hypothetical protein